MSESPATPLLSDGTISAAPESDASDRLVRSRRHI
jgi:hypothetical protein